MVKANALSRVRFGGRSAYTAITGSQPQGSSSNLPKMQAVPPITLSNAAATLGLGFQLFSFAFVLNRSRI